MPSPMTLPAGVTGTNCLAMFDREVGHAVDAGVGDQLDRVRAAHEQVEHVVGLVEEHGGLLPGLLLPPPVGELRGDHRVDVGAELGVAQQADGVAGLVEEFLQILGGHVHPFSSGVIFCGPVEPAGGLVAGPGLCRGIQSLVGDRDGGHRPTGASAGSGALRGRTLGGRVAPHTAGWRAALRPHRACPGTSDVASASVVR